MAKKGIYVIVLGIVILLAILISFVFYFNYNEDKDMSGGGTRTQRIGDAGDSWQEAESGEVEDNGRDLPGESGDFGGGGSGGGGGAGGSGAGSSGAVNVGSGTQSGGSGVGVTGSSVADSGENCKEISYSYALKDLNVLSVCNNLQNNICVDKEVDCSIDVYNLEGNGGVFAVNFVFFERGGDGTPLYSVVKEYFVGSLSNVVFEGSFSVQSEGESGNANKNIDCWALTDKTPVKNVCS